MKSEALSWERKEQGVGIRDEGEMMIIRKPKEEPFMNS